MDKRQAFITKARRIHGNLYNYENVVYSNNKTPVELICSIHASFLIRPGDHVSIHRRGCPECGRSSSIEKRRKSLESFITDARQLHGDKYDYSRVVYHNALTKVQIGYNGEWVWQTPANHLTGHGSISERNIAFKDTHQKGGTVYQKMVKTNIERYGVDLPTQSPEVYRKLRNTAREKYGVDHPSQSHIPPETIILLNDAEKLRGVLQKSTVFELADRLGVDSTTIYRYARQYGIHDGYPSNLERTFGEWLSENKLPFKRHDRTVLSGDEIDFFFADQRIGVELNGLFWHSELSGGKKRRYHQSKYKRCKEIGIRLISIFEDEWYFRQDAVKTVIMTQLGVQRRGAGARTLRISEIEHGVGRVFFEKYHLQGSATTSVCFGAFADLRLVAVMGFGHPGRQSRFDYELKRFCTDGALYPGIASRLFKTFIREFDPNTVVSFCDNRFFAGRSYIQMGFHYDGDIVPDHTYVEKHRIRHHKSKFRLCKLQSKFGVSIDQRTEWEIMRSLGYDRIWDCGKIRFIWDRVI